uniref:Protein UXT n=1 Tax=Hydra vulgaris TaxID=6087 RepID=T2M3E0_HYDVU
MSKNNDLNSKVLQYEDFLNSKLKSDLLEVHKQRDLVYKEMAEYLQLKKTIEIIQQQQKENINSHKQFELRTKIDLGCNFYCQALIPDTSFVYVSVGYGYFVQMTLEEAIIFINKKMKILTEKSDRFVKDSAKIKAHIRLVMEGLREIQNLNVEK